jgi:hypothetical protein
MVANSIKAKTPEAQGTIDLLKTKISTPVSNPSYTDVDRVMSASLEILMGYSNGMIDASQEMLQQFQSTLKDWEKSWDYLPMDIAMEFVRDDKNQIDNNGHKLRVFPSRGFILPVNKKNAIASGIVAKTDAERIPAEIRFSIDEQALTREQVMMLDILANNDWKRPIYFSSPGGSNVSIALYQRGFVKQNGIAYEFTPVVDRNPIDKEKMYKNLTKVYDFGKMNKKGVLTDYYTRRHTSQYRDQFIRLAEAFLNEADELKNGKIQFPGQISELRGAGQSKTADSLQNILKNADKTIADNKKKAIELIDRSINVMPISNVIDYGEPNPGNANFELAPGVTFEGYSDGTLHEYVGVLYRAGNKAKANKLAGEVATQIESILNYFEKSNASFAFNNKPDLISALTNYMIVATYTADAEIGDKNSAVAKRLNSKINALYKVVFPRIYSDLSVDGKERVEIEKLKNHIEAVGVKYGFRATPANISAPTTQENFTPEQLQEMMQQMQ